MNENKDRNESNLEQHREQPLFISDPPATLADYRWYMSTPPMDQLVTEATTYDTGLQAVEGSRNTFAMTHYVGEKNELQKVSIWTPDQLTDAEKESTQTDEALQELLQEKAQRALSLPPVRFLMAVCLFVHEDSPYFYPSMNELCLPLTELQDVLQTNSISSARRTAKTLLPDLYSWSIIVKRDKEGINAQTRIVTAYDIRNANLFIRFDPDFTRSILNTTKSKNSFKVIPTPVERRLIGTDLRHYDAAFKIGMLATLQYRRNSLREKDDEILGICLIMSTLLDRVQDIIPSVEEVKANHNYKYKEKIIVRMLNQLRYLEDNGIFDITLTYKDNPVTFEQAELMSIDKFVELRVFFQNDVLTERNKKGKKNKDD